MIKASLATALAGVALLSMLLTAIGSGLLSGRLHWFAGVCAWLALLLLWSQVSPRQQRLALILAGSGGLCLGLAWWLGASASWSGVLTQNTALIAMLAGVGFLKMISLPESVADEPLPRGRNAFVRTLLGVHLFGAVINMSVVMIIAERLSQTLRLPDVTALLLSRGFSAAALWSPFFAAMGVAITYSPGASLPQLVLHGLPLAAVALLFTQLQLAGTCRRHARMAGFRGYPMHFQSLWIPLLLALAVLVLHRLLPQQPIILMIAALSLLLTLLVLLWRLGAAAWPRFGRYVAQELPRMSGELSLFLAAGVLAVGISSLVPLLQSYLALPRLGWIEASLLLPLIVIAAVFGVHPVISIAVLGAWLAPLQADANLLASLFLSAWAIGVSLSPLSGLNLALQGRYQVPGEIVLRGNLAYAVFMWLVCSGGFFWLDVMR